MDVNFHSSIYAILSLFSHFLSSFFELYKQNMDDNFIFNIISIYLFFIVTFLKYNNYLTFSIVSIIYLNLFTESLKILLFLSNKIITLCALTFSSFFFLPKIKKKIRYIYAKEHENQPHKQNTVIDNDNCVSSLSRQIHPPSFSLSHSQIPSKKP